MFRFLPIRVGYFMLYFALPFFLVSRPSNFRAIFGYFNRRHGFSRWRSFWKTISNYYVFGQVVIDKFYLLSGAKNPFKVYIHGEEHYLHHSAKDAGFMMLGSHVGNFEIAGYLLKSTRKTINAIIFGGELPELQSNRDKALSSNNVRLIPVLGDMSHLFAIKSALDNGEIVSMPGDRMYGSSKSIQCKFVGAEAEFPLGPFLTAAQLNVKILAIFAMKESALRYSVFIKPIEADEVSGRNHREVANVLATKFVHELELVVREYPCQWFNYYEFWQKV